MPLAFWYFPRELYLQVSVFQNFLGTLKKKLVDGNGVRYIYFTRGRNIARIEFYTYVQCIHKSARPFTHENIFNDFSHVKTVNKLLFMQAPLENRDILAEYKYILHKCVKRI